MPLTDREKQLYQLLQENPTLSQNEMADQLGIARASVAAHILNLTQKGYIAGRGYLLSEGNYVLVIGGANVDMVGIADTTLQLHDSNPGKLSSSPGGVGRNIADNLARLGLSTKMLTVVGDDIAGKQLLNDSEAAGIDMRHAKVIDNKTTSTYLSIHDTNGDMTVALADMSIIEQITPEYLQRHSTLIQHAAAVVLDANLSEDSLNYLLNRFTSACFFVDPVSAHKATKLSQHLAAIHTIKPNLLEAEKLSGISIQSIDDAWAAAEFFIRSGVKQACLSLGSKGIVLAAENGERHHYQAKPTHITNATGAGDALMAGLVYGWTHQYPADQTAALACSAAAMTLESVSTILPTMSTMTLQQRCAKDYPSLATPNAAPQRQPNF